MKKINYLVLVIILVFNAFFQVNAQKEVRLDLEKKNNIFKEIIDLKDDGFIIKTFIDKGNYNYVIELHAFDNKLNHKWTKQFDNNFGLDFSVGPTGYPIYTSFRTKNGPVMSKEMTFLKIDSEGNTSSTEIKISIRNGGFKNITAQKNGYSLLFRDYKTKEKGLEFYKQKEYDSDFNFIAETSYSIPTEPTHKKVWNLRYINDDKVYQCLEYYKENKKDKIQKLKAYFINVDLKSNVNRFEFISTHNTIARFKSPGGAGLFNDTKNDKKYLSYINSKGNGFFIDCFDEKGNVNWTKEFLYTEKPSLNRSHLYNSFGLYSLDDNLLGMRILIKDEEHIYNYYITKDEGKLVDKNDYKYKGYAINQMSMVDNFIMTQNEGKIGEVIVRKAKEIESKRDLKNARYTYLAKKNYYIVVVYAENEVSITQIKK